MMRNANNLNSIPLQQVSLLDVNRGNLPILEEIVDAIEEICISGRFIGGSHCQQLEQAIAEYCQAKYAVGCASGSDALLVALMALGIGPGDEVILPSFTFFATASAVWRLGATPVFVDIDEKTFNIDPAEIERAVTAHTRAILPVHLFGQCADMHPIREVAQRHNLKIVEDAAQAIGARYHGESACAMGDVGCLSFYPTKNLGGFGDGGMMTTNDADLAAQLRKFANHGMNQRYYHDEVGVNSRLDSIQAAALCLKLKSLPQWTRARCENADRYRTLFAQAGVGDQVELPSETEGLDHVWNQYTIRVRSMERDVLRESLRLRGVGTEVYYPVPLHLQKCFAHLGYRRGSLPKTEQASLDVLSLPIYPELKISEQEYVVAQIADVLTETELPLRKAS